MASILWVSVFALLCVEVAITLLLCFRATARVICTVLIEHPMSPHVETAIRFITFGLVIGLWDSISTLRYLEAKESAAQAAPTKSDPTLAGGILHYSVDRPRKFRAERNMYLTAFCLVLIVVIRALFLLTRSLILAEKRLGERSPQESSPRVTPPQPTGAHYSQNSVEPTNSAPAYVPVDPVGSTPLEQEQTQQRDDSRTPSKSERTSALASPISSSPPSNPNDSFEITPAACPPSHELTAHEKKNQ